MAPFFVSRADVAPGSWCAPRRTRACHRRAPPPIVGFAGIQRDILALALARPAADEESAMKSAGPQVRSARLRAAPNGA